jgi:hypothetical protein
MPRNPGQGDSDVRRRPSLPPVREHAPVQAGAANQLAALQARAAVPTRAAVQVDGRADHATVGPEAAIHTCPTVIELAAIGKGTTVGQRFVTHRPCSRQSKLGP